VKISGNPFSVLFMRFLLLGLRASGCALRVPSFGLRVSRHKPKVTCMARRGSRTTQRVMAR
ncbi:MAG: hypothetical protein PVF56_24240, partial [Desulfobacterales bacterium]